jgi:hypothetical protein
MMGALQELFVERIETEDGIAEVFLDDARKHLGPGDHPSGSPQTVHAGESNGGDKPASSRTPPAREWAVPPSPRGRAGGQAGGFSANGRTNTAMGDLGERVAQRFNMQSLLPPGKRQNPLDVRYDHTSYAFEVKLVTTQADEYKIKMKASEVAEKEAYARKHGYTPGVIMVVMDTAAQRAQVYWRLGVGNYRLSATSTDWNYMGAVSGARARAAG